ncbi:cold-shock' DNA-binding domain-containing protein [Radiomyces spectabilis]|uniref:cold-shock' DNA-binding domain-containing protein n=1 Tax=Radiomyces spectabilis TaxID=64574 RepID=UPI002220CEEB|nr:cold-shock' DNA-binding domain-containing protein [Radiomyces spectabilis]KAI8393363.1 cold-shock' DNA-binding domain-containing protein [Radiomyces spectabilis]
MSMRKTGHVKFFSSVKGYGFIIPDDQPGQSNVEEVFVHHTAIQHDGGFKSLGEGEQVEYDLVQGPKGMQAANVSGPGGASVKGDPNAGRRHYGSMGQRNYSYDAYGLGYSNPAFGYPIPVQGMMPYGNMPQFFPQYPVAYYPVPPVSMSSPLPSGTASTPSQTLPTNSYSEYQNTTHYGTNVESDDQSSAV